MSAGPINCLDAARDYAARGWSVIPMQPRGDQIEAWFRHWPDANVGIVTGRLTGLIVVDIDAQHGGLASMVALEALHGSLPPTVEALTGGGGRHLYFAHPGTPVANRVALYPGIDLRGDGGCVVAPPSVHPNGRRYVRSPGHGPDDLPLARPPQHFLGSGSVARSPGLSRMHWRRLNVVVTPCAKAPGSCGPRP